jgi:two-component system phosphate regulon response regulator OmpR
MQKANSTTANPLTGSHILVLDDDRRIRQLLARYLKENGAYVSTAETAAAASLLLRYLNPDALIVDIMLPDISGLELTSHLQQQQNPPPILLLTAMGEAEDRIRGFEAGADDYLPKPFEPRELLLRLQRIIKRKQSDDQEYLWRFGAISFDKNASFLQKPDEQIPLTDREETILNALLETPWQPQTRENLAIILGGINPRSVDVLVTRLRQKIEPDSSNPIYIRAIWNKGYAIFPDR